MIGFWNCLRFLVTNKCNFLCPFCHNEGQKNNISPEEMGFDDFRTIINALSSMWQFSDIAFSGGEPFENAAIVEMLKYAAYKDIGDVSCASNLSLATEGQIMELAGSRVKFNVQFPYADEKRYSESTGQSCYDEVVARIDLLRDVEIDVGLNTVLRSFDPTQIDGVLEFASRHNANVKLLPEIGSSAGGDILSKVERHLASRIVECFDKKTGALRWHVKTAAGILKVLFINSPCFRHDIGTCKEYGELRILPNLGLQPCLHGKAMASLAGGLSPAEIQKRCIELWTNFRTCS